jgi:pSer/pThr/pTyr-binding forkhead associated (FHA) protein
MAVSLRLPFNLLNL